MAKNLVHGAQDMFDVLESLTNGSTFGAGHADAVAHIGMMLQGGMSPEAVDDVQDELIDPDGPDYDAGYAIGYRAAWNRTYKLLFDASE